MIIKKSIEGIKEFDNLAIGEKFVYSDNPWNFEAYKIREDEAAFINADGKFIFAHRFTNCLSIGSHSAEYDSLEELIAALPEHHPDYGYVNFSKNRIKELRSITGLSQAAFAAAYNIPLRTIENWESGKNSPPDYVIELLEFKIKSEQ